MSFIFICSTFFLFRSGVLSRKLENGSGSWFSGLRFNLDVSEWARWKLGEVRMVLAGWRLLLERWPGGCDGRQAEHLTQNDFEWRKSPVIPQRLQSSADSAYPTMQVCYLAVAGPAVTQAYRKDTIICLNNNTAARVLP